MEQAVQKQVEAIRRTNPNNHQVPSTTGGSSLVVVDALVRMHGSDATTPTPSYRTKKMKASKKIFGSATTTKKHNRSSSKAQVVVTKKSRKSKHNRW
jgi:hypothetical protein